MWFDWFKQYNVDSKRTCLCCEYVGLAGLGSTIQTVNLPVYVVSMLVQQGQAVQCRQ